jgi:hypothetical protein
MNSSENTIHIIPAKVEKNEKYYTTYQPYEKIQKSKVEYKYKPPYFSLQFSR